MQPIWMFATATSLLLTVVTADLAANMTAFPVPSLPFYEAKSNRDLPENKNHDRFDLDRKNNKKAFVRDGEPTVFNVLVNASGILKFSLASTQPDCDPQQDAQIRIHPVSTTPADMQFVAGNDAGDMKPFKHAVHGSGSRFDFVVNGQTVGITFTELTAMTIAEAEEKSEERGDDDDDEQQQQRKAPQNKTIEISRWMMWDYGLGAQQRVRVNVSSPQPTCNATLIFPSSTAFVFPEEEMPLHLRPTTTVRPSSQDKRRSGHTGGGAATAVVSLTTLAGLLLLTV
ncbi:hypothetical protein AAVH_15374 [Aphelenchoides avenae]|nr:hypothetical protein AAVH_15374 [Aphelenchus avenae]